MSGIFIIKVLLIGAIIGGAMMYMTGNRALKSFDKQNLVVKKLYNPFSILKFLLQLVLLAIFAFLSVLFITKFGV